MSWEISLRDRIHDTVSCNKNGISIMKNAYKGMFKCHIVMLIYHSLYGMDVDVSDFMEAKEKRNKVFEEFKEMNEEKMVEIIKNVDDVKNYEKIANECYLYSLEVINNYTYEEIERLHNFQNKHRLIRDEIDPNFVNDNLNRITNNEYNRFIDENVDVLDY